MYSVASQTSQEIHALRISGGITEPETTKIVAQYFLREGPESSGDLATALCHEHTVELSSCSIGAGYLADHVVGRVAALKPAPQGGTFCDIAYPVETGQGGLTTLLTLVMGNAGFFPQIELIGLELPDALAATFSGPQHGIEGIRRLTDCPKGPLAGTALKPLGASAVELARIARDMAAGGLHIIKEDDGISTQPYAPFAERVAACADAVREGAARNGTGCLYFPNITGPLETLADRAMFSQKCGAGGVELLPGVIGFDAVRMLADLPDFTLPIALHSAWNGGLCRAGNPALSHAVAFGLLPRLAGADISIMPGFGGRFGIEKATCMDIAAKLKNQQSPYKPGFPMPGGGLTLGRIDEFVDVYGQDVVLLMSGALFSETTSLTDSCKEYVSRAGQT